MKKLDLCDNQLTGTPSSLFPCLYDLTGICNPPGPIPAELGLMVNLQYLGLDSNQLNGTPSFNIKS